MQAKDVMTRDLATVPPEASIRDAAKLMTERRLSGLPVVNADGAVVGVLTASDLLHRIETRTERRSSWFANFFAQPNELAREYAKSHGRKVHEVMTRHIISVHEDASLSEVADTFERYQIKRVPVVRGGALVGIVSRGDLVRALSQATLGEPAPHSDDNTLQHALWEQLRKQPWLDSGLISFSVNDGVVEVWGMVPTVEQHRALLVLASEVAGTAEIKDHVKVGQSLPGWI